MKNKADPTNIKEMARLKVFSAMEFVCVFVKSKIPLDLCIVSQLFIHVNTEIKRKFRLSLKHFIISELFWIVLCVVIVTITMYVSFFKYMSFIVTDIQYVEMNKD